MAKEAQYTRTYRHKDMAFEFTIWASALKI